MTLRASAFASTACRSRSSSPPVAWERWSGGDRGAARRPLPRAPQRSRASPTRQQTLTATLAVEPRTARAGRAHAVSPAGGVRRRIRARRGGERVRRDRASTARASPTCWRGSSRNRSWPPRRIFRRASLRLLETVRLSTRASGSRRQARPRRSPTGTPAGRSRWRRRSAARARLDREAANLRAASTRCSRAGPPRRCDCASRSGPSGCAESTSTRRSGGSTRCSPAARSAPLFGRGRCSPRPRSISAAASSPAGSPARARRATSVASEIGDAHAEWRALQILGRVRPSPGDAADVAMPWLERGARARATGGLRGSRRRSASTHSASPLDPRGSGPRRGARESRASSCSARSPAPPSGSPRRQHRGDPDEPDGRPAGAAHGLRGHTAAVCRDLLRRRRQLRRSQTRPGSSRARGDLARARATARRERGDGLSDSGDERGQAGGARPTRLPRARRGRASRRPAGSRGGARVTT